MSLSVLPLDLARWDESARDCLVLPVFKDDRPLRGAAGLADWRLCGRLRSEGVAQHEAGAPRRNGTGVTTRGNLPSRARHAGNRRVRPQIGHQ